MITAANQGLISGGDQSVKCLLIMGGHEIDTGEDRILRVPAEFYEADLAGFDAVLSYECLATYEFVVDPRRHILVRKMPLSTDVVEMKGNGTPMEMQRPKRKSKKCCGLRRRSEVLVSLPKVGRCVRQYKSRSAFDIGFGRSTRGEGGPHTPSDRREHPPP